MSRLMFGRDTERVQRARSAVEEAVLNSSLRKVADEIGDGLSHAAVHDLIKGTSPKIQARTVTLVERWLVRRKETGPRPIEATDLVEIGDELAKLRAQTDAALRRIREAIEEATRPPMADTLEAAEDTRAAPRKRRRRGGGSTDEP